MSQAKPLASIAATVVILLLTSAWVAVVQFPYGSAPLYGYDEAWHLFLATIGPAWKMFLAASGDSHPPVYYLIMRPFLKLGQDPLYARLPTILASIISVPVLFALLRRIRIRTPVALAVVIVLAVSFPFLTLGVTARQYSVSVLILLLAMWFWAGMLAGSRGHPSRWSAILALALFALAFSTLYAAVLVTAALFSSALLVMSIAPDPVNGIRGRWRQYSGWPEWLLFVLAHLLVIGWYVIGWARHIDFNVPSHVAAFTLHPGQSLWDFLHQGLQRELDLFTPLSGLGAVWLDAGLVTILAVALWLTIVNLRNGNALRATLALSPLALTTILALLG